MKNNNRLLIRLALLALCCGLMFNLNARGDTSSAREQLERFLLDLNTYQADFTQVVVDYEQGQEYHSSGIFYLQRPGRFLWKYHEPDNLYVLADGKNIWLVDEDLEQVTQRSQRIALKGTPALLLTGSIDIEQEFELSEIKTSEGLEWMELNPLDKGGQFEQIRMAFSSLTLVRLEMTDKFGQITRFEFMQSRRNPVLEPALFEFKPPPGYDLLEQDE